MEQHHKENVEELISNMECVHDFQCYKNNFESCCQAQTIENADGIIQCGNGCKQANSGCQYKHKMIVILYVPAPSVYMLQDTI